MSEKSEQLGFQPPTMTGELEWPQRYLVVAADTDVNTETRLEIFAFTSLSEANEKADFLHESCGSWAAGFGGYRMAIRVVDVVTGEGVESFEDTYWHELFCETEEEDREEVED